MIRVCSSARAAGTSRSASPAAVRGTRGVERGSGASSAVIVRSRSRAVRVIASSEASVTPRLARTTCGGDPADRTAPARVGQRMGMPERVRAITRRWISLVPSKMV
ncbi:hypothetical protein GA0115238_130319 [Streptomyces sp. di50b]|nr:hypothetical protein GA0115238_130319 [Streptomyces sp. di50b]